MAAVFQFGGDEGDRTPDLLNAIQALSQLSYAPKSFTSDIIRKNVPFVNSFLADAQMFSVTSGLLNVQSILLKQNALPVPAIRHNKKIFSLLLQLKTIK